MKNVLLIIDPQNDKLKNAPKSWIDKICAKISGFEHIIATRETHFDQKTSGFCPSNITVLDDNYCIKFEPGWNFNDKILKAMQYKNDCWHYGFHVVEKYGITYEDWESYISSDVDSISIIGVNTNDEAKFTYMQLKDLFPDKQINLLTELLLNR